MVLGLEQVHRALAVPCDNDLTAAALKEPAQIGAERTPAGDDERAQGVSHGDHLGVYVGLQYRRASLAGHGGPHGCARYAEALDSQVPEPETVPAAGGS